ncbi:hypothetical protein F2Q68_00010785 [Brassica cretica]|uniref:Uncharacterized protein n=1 Tax=Brassica cretica TaxID=69181 RepID=A0A8S9KT95_BRACR|nr:hypothetical protein F2Q68_00010785 [Brassica cretica]
MFVKKPWKWTMSCWEVTGTWVNTKLAVVSPAKKNVVKKHLNEDSPRPQKKAREEATAEASEEATAVARSEVTTTVGGLTKEDIKSMLKDVVDAMSEGYVTCLKEIKYLSERMEAVEKKVGVTTKRKGTSSQNAGTQTRTGPSSQNTTPPPKPTLDLGVSNKSSPNKRLLDTVLRIRTEKLHLLCFLVKVLMRRTRGRKSLPEDKGPDVPADASFSKDKAPETSLSLVILDKTQSTVLDLEKEYARYCERRDAALALCHAKSYDPFAKLSKKKLRDLADWCKMCPDYLTSLNEKPRTSRTWWYQTPLTSLSWLAECRYDANPQHFRSERMCFLDHLFAQQWRAKYQDWKDSKPDQNSLGRRLPGGA